MTVRRAPRAENFTVLNTATFNIAMRWELKGLFLFLLSKPDNWQVQPEHLAIEGECSKDRVHKLLKELSRICVGGRPLIEMGRRIDPQTKRFVGYDYIVSEPPPEIPDTEIPDAEIPEPETPELKNHDLTKDRFEKKPKTGAREEIDPASWEPDDMTRSACQMQGIQISDEAITTYRLKLADWMDKGYTQVKIRSKFLVHCREVKLHAKSDRANEQSDLQDRLEDTSLLSRLGNGR